MEITFPDVILALLFQHKILINSVSNKLHNTVMAFTIGLATRLIFLVAQTPIFVMAHTSLDVILKNSMSNFI